MAAPKPSGPLTPAVFHILLALYGRERHGYDIMLQVREDSQGQVKMGPGTLYGSLDRISAAGLVVESNTQDPRRIYYRLTPLGRAALRAESERLSAVAAIARRRLGATERRAAARPVREVRLALGSPVRRLPARLSSSSARQSQLPPTVCRFSHPRYCYPRFAERRSLRRRDGRVRTCLAKSSKACASSSALQVSAR